MADTFTIPQDRFEEFSAMFAKLNRKAAKLGSQPVGFEVLEQNVPVERSVTYILPTEGGAAIERTKKVTVLAARIRFWGEAPKLAGWKLVARVEGIENEVMVHAVPGYEGKVDVRFRTLGATVCEHCKAARMRKDTYVVEHEDGRQVQVGRQCLGDFTGGASPEKVVAIMSWLHKFVVLRDGDGEGGWWGSSSHYLPAEDALALASAYVSKFGFVSRGSGASFTTSDMVAQHFGSLVGLSGERRSQIYAIEAAVKNDTVHVERAAETAAWVRNVIAAKADPSDYERNLVVAFKVSAIGPRHLGLVVSAMASYLRWQEKEVAARAENAAVNNEWVGAVGERLRGLKVTTLSVRVMEGAYGATSLIKFRDEAGHRFVWFASGDQERIYPIGEATIITGTVKAHNEFKGVKETQLTRVK